MVEQLAGHERTPCPFTRAAFRAGQGADRGNDNQAHMTRSTRQFVRGVEVGPQPGSARLIARTAPALLVCSSQAGAVMVSSS